MKKLVNLAAGLIIGATLVMSASGAAAHDVNVRSHERPVYRQDRPYHGATDHYAYRSHGHYSRYDRDHRPMPMIMRRDRDGDGVPNRYDRAPGNPYRH